MRFIAFFLFAQSVVFSCCDFVLGRNGDFVVGRTMEFETKVSSEILIFPKGNRFVSRLSNNQVGASWIGKYAFMGMGTFGTESLVDGCNEEGLSFGALWFPETEYPRYVAPSRKERISLLEVGNWILSMCATCHDVRLAMDSLEIEADPIPELGQAPPLHFAIHDQTGESLVIEFIKGKTVIYENPVGVLTNAPSFDWQMKNLSNYINLTPLNASSLKFGDVELLPTGQGTGMMGIPGDWTPPSRFVRIAFFGNFLQLGSHPGALVDGALHLINTVDIPFGLVRDREKESFDYTQWSCVKDLKNLALYYRTYRDLNIKRIDLKEEVGKLGRTIRKIPLMGTTP